jgi:hypothetical protein
MCLHNHRSRPSHQCCCGESLPVELEGLPLITAIGRLSTFKQRTCTAPASGSQCLRLHTCASHHGYDAADAEKPEVASGRVLCTKRFQWFTEFDVKCASANPGVGDYVEIFDGTSATGVSLTGQMCSGSPMVTMPSQVASKSSSLYVVFSSDSDAGSVRPSNCLHSSLVA